MSSVSLSDFTKACDRNYLISYLTPSFIYALATYLLTLIYFPQLTTYKLIYDGSFLNLVKSSYTLLQDLWINDFIILTFGTWIISVVLMTINLQLTQFLEGYILLNKTPLLKRQQEKFNALNEQNSKYDSIYDEYNKLKEKDRTDDVLIELANKYGIILNNSENLEKHELAQRIVENYIEVLTKLRTEYPPDISYVLPTSFGNIIRSFELYSYYVYGIDSIAVWTRIIQFTSQDLKKEISDAKAQVDFSVNSFYVVMIIGVEYILYSVMTKTMPSIWVFLLIFIFSWISYNMSLTLAKIWGESVKSVFDLHRGDLLDKMKIPNVTKGNEKEKWMELNRLFLYWRPLKYNENENLIIYKK